MTNPTSIRLLYLVVNENLIDSGILRSQVLSMLHDMRRLNNIDRIVLLSFPSPRLFIKRNRQFNDLKNTLLADGIELKLWIVPTTTKWPWYFIPITVLWCLPVLITHILVRKINIVHTRGYVSGLLAGIVSLLTNTQFVFDPRGPLPEEMAQNGIWQKNRPTFKIWKKIELWIVRKAQSTIGVTPDFRTYYRMMGAKRSVFVPNRGEVSRFMPFTGCVPNDGLFVVFTGEMDSVWYHPRTIGKHFVLLKELEPRLKLRIFTRCDSRFVTSGLCESGLNEDDFIVQSVSPDAIPEAIAGSALGIIQSNPLWGCWPVKFAEYIAAGVPVIVEQKIGSHLTNIIEKYKLGIVIDENDTRSYNKAFDVLQNLPQYRQRCVGYAHRRLNIRSSARQYRRIYRQILNG